MNTEDKSSTSAAVIGYEWELLFVYFVLACASSFYPICCLFLDREWCVVSRVGLTPLRREDSWFLSPPSLCYELFSWPLNKCVFWNVICLSRLQWLLVLGSFCLLKHYKKVEAFRCCGSGLVPGTEGLEIRLVKANMYHLYSRYQGLFTGLDVRVKINLVILVVVEIAYGPPTTFRRNSDGCKAVRPNSVGIVQSQTAIQRSYIFVGNGHMVRRKFVRKFRRNTDDCTVNRNVVGSSSVYSDEFPTTTTVTFFIGMSSKSRRKIPTTHVSSELSRKWPTEFRRFQIFGFRQKLVGNPSQTSDDIDVRRNSACFLAVYDINSVGGLYSSSREKNRIIRSVCGENL
ncbi:hypothetical protein DY000_02056330 [Brassica cretica]|uniref:Uncharacterized protein n=1 Tax=Brassica cretica TaxID=69181 RepID=A0ABQ7AJI3_BRACR|nr:hypothetical protein DY000_02056330 [Brassica cretica]